MAAKKQAKRPASASKGSEDLTIKEKRSGTKSARGTAAAMRAGAPSRSDAKDDTGRTGKRTQKELTMQGGPGRAGTDSGQKRKAKPRSTKRARGSKARAGA